MNIRIFAILAALAGFAVFSSMPAAAATDQVVVDRCIADWGSASPFKKGTVPSRVVAPGVKVFGIGKSNNGDDKVTDKPALILVRAAVNVLGKSTIRLANPKGWYCFKSNVTVAGKFAIDAHCHAHIATAREDGTSVMATDESKGSVAVLGALRVTRFDCDENTEKKKVKAKLPDGPPRKTEIKVANSSSTSACYQCVVPRAIEQSGTIARNNRGPRIISETRATARLVGNFRHKSAAIT